MLESPDRRARTVKERAISEGRQQTSSAKGARLDWVDTGRGVAIILVALFHATNWIGGTGVDVAVWTDVNTVLSTLRMPMFFALSGLFAAKWLTASWGSLLRTKVLLFLWVLILWAAIGMVVQLLGLSVAGKPVNVLGAARDVVIAMIDPPFELWFIWALALFFVVAKLTRRVPPVIQLIVAGVVSAAGLTIWLTLTTGLTGSAKYYFFFLAGMYLRQMIMAFATQGIWTRVAVFAGWAVLSIAIFLLGIRGLPGVYFVNCVIGVFAGVALSVMIARVRLLGRLGRQTLPIYLAHTPIVILVSILLILTPPLLDVAMTVGGLIPPLTATIAIAGAVWLHRAARKSFLRYVYEPPQFVVRLLGGSR